MKNLVFGLTFAVAALAAASAPAATLLTNGSFEDGPALNGQGYSRGVPPTGWSALPGVEVPDILGNAYNQTGAGFEQLLHAQDGSRYLDMNGAGPGGALWQEVTGLAAGSLVTVTYWSSSWAQNSSGTLLATLFDAATNAVLESKPIFYPYNPGATSSVWTRYSISGIVGASGRVRLQFVGSSGSESRGAPGLDNVVMTAAPAVPEPASWAMMIGGFALAGGAMRRRAPVACA